MMFLEEIRGNSELQNGGYLVLVVREALKDDGASDDRGTGSSWIYRLRLELESARRAMQVCCVARATRKSKGCVWPKG